MARTFSLEKIIAIRYLYSNEYLLCYFFPLLYSSLSGRSLRFTRKVVPIDCSRVGCPDPGCLSSDQHVPIGQCCAVCTSNSIDCTGVLCLDPKCMDGKQVFIPEGTCCPRCKPAQIGPVSGCASIICPTVNCPPGKSSFKPPGQCYARCGPIH